MCGGGELRPRFFFKSKVKKKKKEKTKHQPSRPLAARPHEFSQVGLHLSRADRVKVTSQCAQCRNTPDIKTAQLHSRHGASQLAPKLAYIHVLLVRDTRTGQGLPAARSSPCTRAAAPLAGRRCACAGSGGSNAAPPAGRRPAEGLEARGRHGATPLLERPLPRLLRAEQRYGMIRSRPRDTQRHGQTLRATESAVPPRCRARAVPCLRRARGDVAYL